MQKISIHNEEKIKELLIQNGHKAFRYAQIENALYKNFITNFDEMTTLSKEIRELLNENVFVFSLQLEDKKTDKNGQTTKLLFKTQTGELIESVIMRHLT
jgi:23S rRNA (adenine2503-C2)-methyltransferase